MPPHAARAALLTGFSLLGFAGNSILGRAALAEERIDPASFSAIRLLSGAVTLWLLAARGAGLRAGFAGSWVSGALLFLYAVPFSFAYVSLATGTGALILFGAVQVTMVGAGLWSGERPSRRQGAGFVLAVLGLVYLLLPGASAPSPLGSALMAVAGVAWGAYSLRGRGASKPLQETTGNFIRSVPLALLVWLVFGSQARLTSTGIGLAVASGAVASALGYAAWYRVLPSLSATLAATVQLSVPVLAAAGGVALLGEAVTVRLAVASFWILGGIALAVMPTGRVR